MLAWYDRHAREMPWRVGPDARRNGQIPDPYSVWLSEIMLQQTTVAAVGGYFRRFIDRWPTVQDLAAADDADVMAEWAGLGYYARARNLLKCAREVSARHGGAFPRSLTDLLKLPGIGPYTAAAISAIAFDQPETVVDGNIERVVARLFDIHTALPDAKQELKEFAAILTPDQRPGDYAQAMMDLGATICIPRHPNCGNCPIRSQCRGHAAGTAVMLPFRAAKKPKPTRYGVVYLGQRRDGAWLVEQRPSSGLLGGMLGWPGPEWTKTPPKPGRDTDWVTLPETVRHTFTHFHLILEVRTRKLAPDFVPETGYFLPLSQFSPSDMPTVMRKAYDLCKSATTSDLGETGLHGIIAQDTA